MFCVPAGSVGGSGIFVILEKSPQNEYNKEHIKKKKMTTVANNQSSDIKNWLETHLLPPYH